MPTKRHLREYLEIPDWALPVRDLWIDWLEERVTTRAGFPSLRAQKIHMKRLLKYSNGGNICEMKEVLENAIAGHWENLYPLNQKFQPFEQQRFKFTP
jgi:hypothetical protein